MRTLFLILSWFTMIWYASCTQKAESTGQNVQIDSSANSKRSVYKKRAGLYADTLMITPGSAVFFHGDSLQQKHFQESVSPMVYESTLHETEYQIKNARLVLNKNWEKLRVLDADHHRFIACYNQGVLEKVVDLNDINDLSGLLLFKAGTAPLQPDMMNIDTELEWYFNR